MAEGWHTTMANENIGINIDVTPAQVPTTVNGVVVNPGQPFTDIVISTAAGMGANNFRVILNGAELHSEEDAPATIEAGDTVRVERVDKAGSN